MYAQVTRPLRKPPRLPVATAPSDDADAALVDRKPSADHALLTHPSDKSGAAPHAPDHPLAASTRSRCAMM